MYDPILKKWIGNEDCLLKFETKTVQKKPELIKRDSAIIPGGKLVRRTI
jgi:hypothetical protein